MHHSPCPMGAARGGHVTIEGAMPVTMRCPLAAWGDTLWDSDGRDERKKRMGSAMDAHSIAGESSQLRTKYV